MKGVLLIHTGVPKSTNRVDLNEFQQEIADDSLVINPKHGIPDLSEYEISDSMISQYQKIRLSLLKRIKSETNIPVVIASHYGEPSIRESLEKLVKLGVTELLVHPLYPQFASSTIWSAISRTGG